MLQPQARKPVRDPETSIGEFASHGPELQPECVTPQEFREALSRAVTPVTVIATSGPSGTAGVTCSAVCSVSDTPPTVLVCVNRKSFANGIIKANGVLTVNWLSAAQSSVLSSLQASAPSRWRSVLRLVNGRPLPPVRLPARTPWCRLTARWSVPWKSARTAFFSHAW